MRLYNTLNRKKEEFVPLQAGEVKMYSCGPTVYNYFHIGNARPFIVFDSLRRYFEYKGYKVKFVQNFTDIDDKMIKRANEESITVEQLATRFINEYFIDSQGLGIKKADIHPKATENIDAIIDIISALIEKGYAYEVDGDVYFSTKKFKEYGKLSHQPLDDLESGARIEIDARKKDPMDFALWKNKKDGEPYYESPWGQGRPGWHIECSAMANRYLGQTIDIHSGGQDLIFPHHENEIAQSEAANGQPFARYWLHNGYINVDNQKMSKSLNNFFTVRDVAKEYDYDVIRFFMLSAHYRNPVNFSKDLMEQSKSALGRLKNCVENLDFLLTNAKSAQSEQEKQTYANILKHKQRFEEALDDDFNTADAISVLFDMAKDINISVNEQSSKEFVTELKDLFLTLSDVLGIVKVAEQEIPEEIQNLAQKRLEAKQSKDWAQADMLRDLIKEKGYIIEDSKEGTKIKKA